MDTTQSLMGRTPSITAIQYISSASQPWTEGKNGQYTDSPRTSTTFGCEATSNGYVQQWRKYRQIWISAFHNFSRVSGFHKTSSATISQGRASPILNHKSTASKVLATQETPPPIPLSPAEPGRRGPGRGLLKESNAYRQRLYVMVRLGIQITQFIPCFATLQVP